MNDAGIGITRGRLSHPTQFDFPSFCSLLSEWEELLLSEGDGFFGHMTQPNHHGIPNMHCQIFLSTQTEIVLCRETTHLACSYRCGQPDTTRNDF